MYSFDVEKRTRELNVWIQEYFAQSGENTKAVIGISGGKDSSIENITVNIGEMVGKTEET